MQSLLLIRAVVLYVPIAVAMPLWFLLRPPRAERAGILLACLWNAVSLLAIHGFAIREGWWNFHANGGLLLGFPVDLYLGWIVLWGVLPLLAFPKFPLPAVALFFFALDVVCMPKLAPLVSLGRHWWLADIAAIFICLIPSQLLGRWTRDDTHLPGRASLQVIAFSGLTLGLLPAIILNYNGGTWRGLQTTPSRLTGILLQLLAIPALLGLSAVQEFAQRGQGTPLPYDPPKRMVTSGIYAYIANPMQLSAVLLLVGWGWFLGSIWVAAAGVMAHIYSAGLAAWDESEDIAHRFGPAWKNYRTNVRPWVPRWRPWHASLDGPARLYVSETCGQCSEVKRWFERQGATGMSVIAAELFPSREIMRMTYDPGDGSPTEQGVAALARGLEHIHFAFALLGCLMRMPVLSSFIQLLADVSGAGPRSVVSGELAQPE